jgi:hypothetical protein
MLQKPSPRSDSPVRHPPPGSYIPTNPPAFVHPAYSPVRNLTIPTRSESSQSTEDKSTVDQTDEESDRPINDKNNSDDDNRDDSVNPEKLDTSNPSSITPTHDRL